MEARTDPTATTVEELRRRTAARKEEDAGGTMVPAEGEEEREESAVDHPPVGSDVAAAAAERAERGEIRRAEDADSAQLVCRVRAELETLEANLPPLSLRCVPPLEASRRPQ